MTTILTERPWVLMLLGAAGIVLGIAGAIQTGRRGPLWFSLICAVLLPVALLVERWWVTHREEIAMFLDQLADDVQANRHEAVLAAIESDAILDATREQLARHKFLEARVLSIRDIELFETRRPPEAVVQFNAMVRIERTNRYYFSDRAARGVKAWLRREPEGWRVFDVEHYPIGQRGPPSRGRMDR
jgi:hypothetical protein